jgi:hypothetical protein
MAKGARTVNQPIISRCCSYQAPAKKTFHIVFDVRSSGKKGIYPSAQAAALPKHDLYGRAEEPECQLGLIAL